MEFSKKLQSLRKQKGLTQEELSNALFVSRTAVSKWESGRGFPNIESLKQIAAFFDITVDELLSGGEMLNIAEKKENAFCDILFGILDIASSLLFFFPLFAQRAGDAVSAVSLLSLQGNLKVLYLALVTLTILTGVLTLALQNCDKPFLEKVKRKTSLTLNVISAILLVLGLQPYAAVLLFVFLAIKILIFIKMR